MDNLKLKKSILYTALALALSTLTGCPGSIFNSSSNNPGLKLSGKLVDGYVKNATVTLDLNDDRICSSTEPKTVTDASGNFSFTAAQNSDGGQHMTCATGGIDLSTGLPLAGQLLAPPGATQITPLTSVVMAQINSTLPVPVAGRASVVPAASITTAKTSISAALGLTGTDLLTADPVALATTTPALLQATAAVQVLMQQTAATVSAVSGAPASQDNTVFQNAMNGVAAALTATTGTPVSLSATFTAITNSVVSATVTSTQTSLASAAALNPSDTALATASTKAATLAPASVAAFAATSVSTLVNTVATATNLTTATGAANPATVAQSNVTIANATDTVSSLLTTAVANANTGAAGTTLLTNLATLGTTIETQLAATSAGTTTSTNAATLINSALTTATATITVPAGTSVPTVTSTSVIADTRLQNVVPITSIAVNGTTATNANGVPTASTAAGAGIASATLNLGLASPTNYALPATADIAFNVISGVRQFTLVIKGLTVTPNGAGAFTLTVPASGATLTAYGVKAAGNTVNATVSQAILSAAITSTISASGSAITVNVGSLLTELGKVNSGFSTLASLTGTYTVTAAISGIPLAVSSTVAASTTTIAIPNTTNSVTGSSQSASVTVN